MTRRVGIIILVVGVLAALGAGGWWFRSKGNKEPTFRTAQVKRGNLVATISASGTVEPQQVVDVGAQVAGLVVSFGTDKNGKPIDYGSIVEQGTVLAKIDSSLYVAALETAKAQLLQAQANVLQMKANLLKAQNDWDRAQKLGPSDALAQTVYDQYQATYEVAKANLAAAEAAVAQAKASVHTAEINVAYCTVTSPVKGVIVDRRVNIGQTVISSLSSPSLFLIAKDLKRIQVWASVNEADIGSISKGQPATFTVDAYPDQIFDGLVGKARLNATMTQNVVTYTVEIDTKNDDGKLLPYLTANVQFKIGRRQGVLLVPNAAIRWTPSPDKIAPETQRASNNRHEDSANRDSGGSRFGIAGSSQTHGIVWVEQGKFVTPVSVNVGMSDGTVTEIEGNEVKEGMRVIVGERTKEAAKGPSDEQNPFTPQAGRGQRQGQGGPGGPGGGR
jgi:HlyD family secretion protein